MKKDANVNKTSSRRRTRPPMDPDARENEMINLASNLAEQQLRDGTASSQVITHYLKLGTAKARLEKTLLQEQINLAKAKTKSYQTAEQTEATIREAVEAMKRYKGASEEEFDDSYLQ